MKKLLLPALCAILLLCGCTRTPDTRPEPSAPTDPSQPGFVLRGGECTLESLVREDEAPATLILSGGSFTETGWLPFGTIAYVGAGTLNARGIRYWDTVHVLGGEIIDPLDRENEG